ncbi:MAG: sigma-70 family RNA polymerase sigma factor [Bacteroidales bacterium]
MKNKVLLEEGSYLKSDLFVDSVNERTPEVFGILYSLYSAQLILFSSKYLVNKCDAEDLIQDVFIEFWQRKSKFSHIAQVKSYLYKATKSHTLNFIKREKKMVYNISFLEYEQADDKPNNFFDLHHELCLLFDSSLMELPRECKRIMRYIIKGLNSFEIAKKLNTAPSTVRAQKRRGLSLIKEICFRSRRCKELINS